MIIAHRGYWIEEKEKNTKASFLRAFTYGYGIETDIRDYKGELVISHNMADKNSMKLSELLDLYDQYGNHTILALNVKADGLQEELERLLGSLDRKHYFLFDMSVPEQVIYIKKGFCTFGRQSEYEPQIVQYESVDGVWMDEFSKEWITKEEIQKHLRNRKQVGVISPEIHNRNREKLWKILKEIGIDSVLLCTDLPKEAEAFFYEKD